MIRLRTLLRTFALVTLLAAPVFAQDATPPADLDGKPEPAPPVPIPSTSPEATMPVGSAELQPAPSGTTVPKTYGAGDADYEAFTHHIDGTFGPSYIQIRDQATLELPEGFIWVPEKPAAAIMQKLGNAVGDAFVGLILPQKNNRWFISVVYDPAGHIDDGDARGLDSEKLLKEIREGNEGQNANRRKEGRPETEVVGWVEKPRYNPTTHRLFWSLAEHNRSGTADSENGVNYLTMALGREGYISMTLVTSLAAIDTVKPIADDMIGRVSFSPGRGYGDFDSKTDRLSTYGLAGLITGNGGPQFVWTDFVFPILAIVLVMGIYVALRRKLLGDDDKNSPPAFQPSATPVQELVPPSETSSQGPPPSVPPPHFKRNDPTTDL